MESIPKRKSKQKPKNQINAPRAVTPSTILSERLSALQERLNAEDISAESSRLLKECISLIEPLDDYLAAHSTRPSGHLQQLEAETNVHDWDQSFAKGESKVHLEREMLSGAVEGQFLKMLAALSKARYVLEIGSFTGYASLAMAEGLPPDGKLIACELDPLAADFAENYLKEKPHGQKIRIHRGDALKTMSELAAHDFIFDLVFIDADKENYIHYYHALFDLNLIKIGSIIGVDNTLYMGQVYNPAPQSGNGEAIRQFNKAVQLDDRVEQVLLPLRDGLSIIRRVR